VNSRSSPRNPDLAVAPLGKIVVVWPADGAGGDGTGI
jgi:hypothetical protein